MKTIRRNAVRKIRKILDNAHNISVYTLDNGFCAQESTVEALERTLNSEVVPGRLTVNGSGTRYTVHVHSNRWYSFDSVEV